MNPFKWLSDKINGIGYRFEGALIVPQAQTIKLTQDDLPLGIPQPAGEYDYNGKKEAGVGRQPKVLESTPFLKWVLGLDYTFGEHVYINAMWVHGMVDEFGAGDWIHEGYVVRRSSMVDGANILGCASQQTGETCSKEILRPRLGDYVVLGADFKFANDAGLFRLFTILDATPLVEETWDDTAGKRVRRTISPLSSEGLSMIIFPELDYNFGNGLELSAGALIGLGASYTKFGDPSTGGNVVFTRGRYSF